MLSVWGLSDALVNHSRIRETGGSYRQAPLKQSIDLAA